MCPVIESIEVKSRFRFLWLKYVNGVNLNVHCAKCLLGEYTKRISPTMELGNSILLDESPARYFYLCGVALPYQWEKNFHLAFEYSKGSVIDIDKLGIKIRIKDAKELPIMEINHEVCTHPFRRKKEYYTCRNWQFAVMIAETFALAKG